MSALPQAAAAHGWPQPPTRTTSDPARSHTLLQCQTCQLLHTRAKLEVTVAVAAVQWDHTQPSAFANIIHKRCPSRLGTSASSKDRNSRHKRVVCSILPLACRKHRYSTAAGEVYGHRELPSQGMLSSCAHLRLQLAIHYSYTERACLPPRKFVALQPATAGRGPCSCSVFLPRC